MANPYWRRALIRHRIAAAVEHTDSLGTLPNILTVVDVGANRGQFALVARQQFPSARITSFEPLPEPAAEWRQLFLLDKRTHIVEAAIGDSDGVATMHISGKDDSSSLLPIKPAQDALFPGTAEVGTIQVGVSRLSSHIPKETLQQPALLKIDVQGFELQVLTGCADLLDRFDWVYVECSFVELYEGQALVDQVVDWLREHGFFLRGAYNIAYGSSREAVQGDFLFSRLSSG